MNKKILVGIIAAVIVVGTILVILKNNTNKTTLETESATITNSEKVDITIKNDTSTTEEADIKIATNGQKSAPPQAEQMTKPGSYKDYSANTVMSEQKAGNKIVLFFHAPWCPYCKAANTEFLNRTNEIPSGVTVLKTDYDSNTDLKKKYGITYQHTFVQIDTSGNQVTKWNGGDVDALKKYLK